MEEKIYCEKCKKEIKSDDVYENNDGLKYCGDCYDELFYECHDCNEETSTDERNICYDDYSVCDTCRDDYSYCENCGCYVNSDDYAGDGLCNSCHDNDDNEDSDSGGERHYDKGNTYCSEKGRAYAVEIETNYDETDDRRHLFNLPYEVGITDDGSLGSHGVELQTPKLSGVKGDELLKKICKHLNDNNFSVDRQCGLHIHIDTADFFEVDDRYIRENHYSSDTPEKELLLYQKRDREQKIVNRIKTLMLFYIAFEPVIYSFMPMARRTNRYCYPLSEFYHESEITNADSLEDLETIWYREQSKEKKADRKKEKYDETRYAGYNFHCMLSAKHIESRHHSGTLDYNKMKNWTELNITILDNVIGERVKMSELKIIKHAIDISQKTKLFFDMIGVNKKLQAYFLARQKKFCAGSIAKQNKCAE